MYIISIEKAHGVCYCEFVPIDIVNTKTIQSNSSIISANEYTDCFFLCYIFPNLSNTFWSFMHSGVKEETEVSEMTNIIRAIGRSADCKHDDRTAARVNSLQMYFCMLFYFG